MRIPGRLGAVRRVCASVLPAVLGALALVAASSAIALAQDIFTVRDVAVDATGESAAEAREKAVAEGHVRAYRQLLERLVPRTSLSAAPQLGYRELLDYVQGFRVADERTSDVRYLANLTFSFQPGQIRDLLARSGVPFVETRRKPALLLAVWAEDGERHLWDDPNPWREHWSARRDDGLVPILTPLGDLQDIAVIDAETAAALTPAPLQQLETRYQADGVIVSEATLSGDPAAGDATLTVESRAFALRDLPAAGRESYRLEEDETLEALLARAAAVIDDRLQEAWKRENQVRYGAPRQIAVTVPISGLNEWAAIQRRLRQTPTIQRVELRSLRRDSARLNLHFLGSEAQLGRALAQRDLTLALTAGSEWDLRPRAPLAPSATAPDTGVPAQPAPEQASPAAPTSGAQQLPAGAPESEPDLAD